MLGTLSAMDFSGRLAAFPMGDLLQWAKNERRTGALVIRRSAREKRVYLDRGDVVGCVSDDPAEFYGQHLLLQGHLTERQLFQALTHCTQQKVRLGTALRELGLLAEDVIQRTLREHIEDAIWDMFLWPRGLFYFQQEMLPEEDLLPEPIDTFGLILEGTRWIDEMERMRRVLVHDGVVLRRGERWPGTYLSPLDRRVVSTVEGQTVGELFRKVKGSYFRLLESVYRLCIASVLDIEDVQEEAPAGTFEMSVYDLLLEQATEDQVLVARKHMAVPLDLLERCCPIWVAPPSEEEEKRMPTRARAFYNRLDGRTLLAEAFSGEARLRGRELDLLLLQLRKGRLALLPASLDQLEQQAEQGGVPVARRWWRRS
ncbi:MAG TPA: hypothetical protein DD490_18375 [Acidobacteria bacterium]|nr:hypothetical protein [Acidobacteriota bacterium]